MPTDLDDVSTGGPGLVFAGEAQGVRFRLAERGVYDAAEVRVEIHGDDAIEDDEEAAQAGQPPAWGRWLRAEADQDDIWMLAPGELIDELQRLDPEAGELFEVTRIEKTGPQEADPFEVNLERLSDDTQTRL